MWLDMYAEERHHISRKYKNETLIEEIWDITYERLANNWFNYIFRQSMYWRKAYWVHEYFVNKLQGWDDDGSDAFIPEGVMEDLLDRIKKILKEYKKWGDGWINKAKELLPRPSYAPDYEEREEEDGTPHYIESLKDTKEWLIEALKNTEDIDYFYSSSR